MLPARATFAYDAVPAVSAAVLRAEASRIRLKSMSKHDEWLIIDSVRTEFYKSREDLRHRADLEVSA
jgi:hypothetical protein